HYGGVEDRHRERNARSMSPQRGRNAVAGGGFEVVGSFDLRPEKYRQSKRDHRHSRADRPGNRSPRCESTGREGAMSAPQPESSPATPTRKTRGCLFWAFVMVVVVSGGGYLAYRYAIHRIVTAYTETKPLDLGEPLISAAEFGALDGRLAAFAHAVRNKTPVEPLGLTGEERAAP